jgi:hypothetical protein
MAIKLKVVRNVLLVAGFLIAGAFLLPAQPTASDSLSSSEAQAKLDRALANELHAAEDTSHPMRYELHKVSQRLSSTRAIYETKDGDVARLLSINGEPLSGGAEQRELARLDELAGDPTRQRHRQQAEQNDTERALKVLRVLPTAFVYQYDGPSDGPTGKVEKFSFHPSPKFSPPDLETQVLTAMTGEIWIDPKQERVAHLEGHVQQDVDYGWGILGRLDKGGWITIDQAEVLPGQWRTVRMQMSMTARIVFKTRSFVTAQEQSLFASLPQGMGYREAIDKLKNGEHGSEGARNRVNP